MNIGFWKDKHDPETADLPLPIPDSTTLILEKETEFLEKLKRIEKIAENISYMGHSNCRICGCINGCDEYKWNGFVFPEGYKHYIEKHHINVPEDFYIAVMESDIPEYKPKTINVNSFYDNLKSSKSKWFLTVESKDMLENPMGRFLTKNLKYV